MLWIGLREKEMGEIKGGKEKETECGDEEEA